MIDNQTGENNSKKFIDSQNPNFSWDEFYKQMEEKELIFRLIDQYSDKLKKQKGIESVIIDAHNGNICDIDYSKHCFDKMVTSKENAWLNKIKKYYVVQYHSHDFQEYINSEYKSDEDKKEINAKIELEAWVGIKGKYFEWIVCLFLLRFSKNDTNNIDLSKNRGVAIEFGQMSRTRFLWYQKSFTIDEGLNTRPDFIVSRNRNINHSRDVIGIIECKYIDDTIGSSAIRDIFSKGYELRPHYIWLFSMNILKEERKEIIDNYGIDVFDEFRDYIENEKDLSYKNTFEEKLKNSIMRRRFIRKIIDDATDKLNLIG